MSEVPAARHTLRIIRYLAGHSGPVRASTVSRDLGLPRSTVYHLLTVMRDEGFLLHSPEDQAYLLSPLVADIGSSVLRTSTAGAAAASVVSALTSRWR